jgi:hypothetical protein
MNHSTWDLEVHAREMQRRRFREAEQARQIEAARQRGDGIRIPARRFSISRLFTAFRESLSPRPMPFDGTGSTALLATRVRPLPAEEPQLMPNARAGGLSQPYAGMVVLARGTRAPTTAQPCAAGDC